MCEWEGWRAWEIDSGLIAYRESLIIKIVKYLLSRQTKGLG